MPWLVTILDPYATIAPLGTLLFAALAFGVAFSTLNAQKRIARGRAAIDFFLKTEMDASMLEAYEKYKEAIEQLKNSSSIQMFKTTPAYDAIRTYLDINELMAIAVSKNVFSMQVCYNFWRNVLREIAEEAKPVIDDAQLEKLGANRYDGIIDLNKLWSGPSQFYQFWRR